MAEAIFLVAGLGAVAGAIGVVVFDNPFYSVLSLVFHLLALAALFLLLRAEFVAAAQVVVYAGAVMVLYVFVVSYVGEDRPLAPSGPGLRLVAVLFAGLLAVELFLATLGSGLKAIDSEGAPFDPAFGSPGQIGELFLTRFLLPFEIASYLLLIAAVGAVILARRRRGLDDDDGDGDGVPTLTPRELMRVPFPEGTGTMAEVAGVLDRQREERERDRGGW